MSDIKIEVIKNINSEFIKEWSTVWKNQQGAHFFNSPEWFISCLESFSIKKYFIFVGYQAGNIKVIYPVVKIRKFGVSFLGSPGGKYLDKSSLLYVNNSSGVVKALLEKMLKDDNIYLAEVDGNTKNKITSSGITSLVRPISSNPFISLDSEPFRFLKNKQRNEIRNKVNRYQNNLSFRYYTDNVDTHVGSIFAIEEKSFKRKKGRHIFSKKIARDLYSNIARVQGCASIAILCFNSKPIAHMFGLIYKKKFQAYHMAYLEDFRKLIPGKVLLYFLLPKLVERGFVQFDFSRGDSLLKKQFTSQRNTQYEIFLSKKKSSISIFLVSFFPIRSGYLLRKILKNS